MLALYRSGRQADALAVYQRARATFVDELGIEPSETLRKLERAILAHDPSLDVTKAPRRIPTPTTPLLGRERELAALADVVRDADTRLVTLIGIGGIGKTRLGIELVRRLGPEFQQGAAVATLATLRDPELVARAILEALEIPESGQDAEELLATALADSELLLLLDNFEQLLPAARTIARLLDAAPRLKIVVTSRAPLHVAAEREFPVPPLADDEAAELFVSRAQAANPNFDLTEQNAAAVAELCARLDGLPLAIELAAARTKLLPPATLLSRLGNRLALLTGGRRDAPKHQQTLRMTLDWSYDLLEADAQQLFAQLGVFSGGCTLASAEAVCDVDGSVLEGLGALVDESLLRQRETMTGEPRFSMLEIVREYALERLGEHDDLRRRHLEHFVALAEEASPHLSRGRRADRLVRAPGGRTRQLPRRARIRARDRRRGVGASACGRDPALLADPRLPGRGACRCWRRRSPHRPDERSELRADALNMLGILSGRAGRVRRRRRELQRRARRSSARRLDARDRVGARESRQPRVLRRRPRQRARALQAEHRALRGARTTFAARRWRRRTSG